MPKSTWIVVHSIRIMKSNLSQIMCHVFRSAGLHILGPKIIFVFILVFQVFYTIYGIEVKKFLWNKGRWHQYSKLIESDQPGRLNEQTVAESSLKNQVFVKLNYLWIASQWRRKLQSHLGNGSYTKHPISHQWVLGF
jgi:hypothetical protein